ncbi:phenazine-specific anthranilate synthase component I [Kitasatospora herbaricolor]|uniref:anthranilate synthase family protein n=1 Tax=Kitasatospora herbaricolor TaxID=68217 RepID=UPI00174EA0D4|nr:anthranilate synthase family protein [Kitasatospora herbaricolor]MDQ0307849.1 phenazine biosynthesis protein phzE [Kitasatospora herbaricolor]GGV25721.1 phenazine-specific anthranilate synthase component I [Kitasatospora herbaricolor]
MTSPTELLARLTAPGAPAFALLHRRAPRLAPDTVEVLLGTAGSYEQLADLPVRSGVPADGPRHDVLALVPYRQIRERGFDAHDDGTPLQAISVDEEHAFPLAELLPALPQLPVSLSGGGFDIDDERYADIVRGVIRDEIGRGEGANFVIRRDFTATLDGFGPALALSLFRRLLEQERGAYWTFLVHTGERVLVGASPEVHVRQSGGTVVMNPISGTYRYPAAGPGIDSLLEFLQDPKELEELTMVVDEELKMMCTVGDLGGQVLGPRLKEMAHLAHTEYELRGRTSLDVREVLKETMFAATVTGSPVQNATRVIKRYEATGRGYYSGALALIGRSASGGQLLDSPICIRAADIDPATGRLVVRVGATLVRHSDPASEVAETHAKAAGVLTAIGARPAPAHRLPRPGGPRLSDDHRVQTALDARRANLAPFWLRMQEPATVTQALPTLVVDGEDTFTSMLAHLLASLGHQVSVLRYDTPGLRERVAAHPGTLVLGPGPGDPADAADPKMAVLRPIVADALAAARSGARSAPLLAVCLSHQLLSDALGLPLARKAVPYQGAQEAVDLFGERRTVGFYNTFTARCSDAEAARLAAEGVEVARDPATGDVHALRGPGFAGLQFHPESVLTRDGVDIVAGLLARPGVRGAAGAALLGRG